eukprot:scaffold237164_cov48-Attheya_sp.AAC.2
MDVKRPLLTQVPSQTDDTTTIYDDSSRIGLRIEFDGYEEATFDPSSVSNRCWDQKIRLPCTSIRDRLVFELSSMDMKGLLLTQVPSQMDVGIES